MAGAERFNERRSAPVSVPGVSDGHPTPFEAEERPEAAPGGRNLTCLEVDQGEIHELEEALHFLGVDGGPLQAKLAAAYERLRKES